MPGGDRTGPLGMGPMTGRAGGYCTGFQMPGFANSMDRYGFGMRGGRGGGRGHRHRFYATGLTGWQRGMPRFPFPGYYPGPLPSKAPFNPAITREQEADMLKSQVEEMEDTISGMKKRIQEIEPKEKK